MKAILDAMPPMRLDPVSLQLFVSLIETGTIAGTGACEHLAASAVSKRISELEAVLDTRLLVRTNKGVEPTAAGRYPLDRSDPDARFCAGYDFQADQLVPQIACPHAVDNVTELTQVAGTPVQQAYLGSCTGGRYHDLAAAVRILRGRKVAPGVRLLVSPASQETWLRASRAGLLTALAEAGATILPPTCGVCVGLHSGLLADGETCLSTTNRNFIGRMGSKGSSIYLGSPMAVAASAVTGRITDPRAFL
jgi:3-isopropylmalate/(R)-2-methylmalate dehydratase large subunit